MDEADTPDATEALLDEIDALARAHASVTLAIVRALPAAQRAKVVRTLRRRRIAATAEGDAALAAILGGWLRGLPQRMR